MVHLAKDGRCCIVVPDGVLFNSTNMYKNTRKYLLENFDGGDFKFLPNDFLNIRLLNFSRKIKTVTTVGMVNSPGTFPIVSGAETLSSFIDKSGGLHPSINIYNIQIKRDSITFGSKDGNVILSPGDTIIGKPYEGIVRLEGEFNFPNAIEWLPNRSVKDYIDLAGGLNIYGDKKNIIYIAPYGEAIKIKKSSSLKVLPGGKIIVKRRLDEDIKAKPDRFQQVSSIITSLVTLAILANSISPS